MPMRPYSSDNQSFNVLLQKEDVSCFVLNSDFVNPVLDLQEQIITVLTKAQTPRYILRRTRTYIQTHLAPPHAILGVCQNNVLTAQMILHAPIPFDVQELGVSTLPHWQENQRVCVLQGMIVAPQAQGQGLGRILLESAQIWCQREKIKHMAARVESSHSISFNNFMREGFTCIETVQDPRDGAYVNVLYKMIASEEA